MEKGKFNISDELELWKRIKRGHHLAKLELFKKYRSSVLELSLIFHQQQTVLFSTYDLYSIGIEKLWNIIDDFEPALNIRFWTFARKRIWGTMKTVLRDSKNKERRTVRAMVAVSDELEHRLQTVDSNFEYQKKIEVIDYALKRLTKKERFIAVEYFMQDKTSSELGELLQCSAASVRTQIWALRKKLKEILEGHSVKVHMG